MLLNIVLFFSREVFKTVSLFFVFSAPRFPKNREREKRGSRPEKNVKKEKKVGT